jgi:hypothetical protein
MRISRLIGFKCQILRLFNFYCMIIWIGGIMRAIHMIRWEITVWSIWGGKDVWYSEKAFGSWAVLKMGRLALKTWFWVEEHAVRIIFEDMKIWDMWYHSSIAVAYARGLMRICGRSYRPFECVWSCNIQDHSFLFIRQVVFSLPTDIDSHEL